jgi:transglutaminase-like putative cysteine protease
VVVHETHYTYEVPVGISRQVLHLTPRQTSWQSLLGHQLRITPLPEITHTATDPFGNPVRSFCVERDHDTLSVACESHVEVRARVYPAPEATPPWETVRDLLSYKARRTLSPEALVANQFLFESARVRNKRELAAWASSCFGPGEPLLVGVSRLMQRIHGELTFDPKATTVSTPVMEVWKERRGVCQDFAHLFLSCIRSLGLSARYVSGYLLTRPPPGKKRLIGADASHAWVSVYCPHGDSPQWVDVDPTNGTFVGEEHVTLGWGRDYDDVIPLRGVLLGGGNHELRVQVTVLPESERESLREGRARAM